MNTRKKKHKLNHHEQQDLIATPWQIWERAEVNEYIEPDCLEDTGVRKGAEEREEEQVWIDRGVIIKEQERQTARFGKGTLDTMHSRKWKRHDGESRGNVQEAPANGNS
jgi:hypothetical protein